MLLWAGLGLIILGIACVAIDRRAVHFIYDHVGSRFHAFLSATTHFAKAAHWLAAALAVYALTWLWLQHGGAPGVVRLAFQCALAFIISLGLGSALLHGTKLVLGRRRPRDELEMNLYGFIPFGFSLDWNSFPSGHALTIFCVAVIATALWPQGALLWFAVALWLGLTRALLTAHFLSDVLVGAGVGLISAREVLVNFFPHLALAWF
ncbi:MAG: phosphatase PAP2 family protein [Alphaproteobacteria bacterium]|nr:phosphatase PAP2 family protein [Alphaproteobacteria bacterium]